MIDGDEETSRCPHCGNDAGATPGVRFCGHCGEELVHHARGTHPQAPDSVESDQDLGRGGSVRAPGADEETTRDLTLAPRRYRRGVIGVALLSVLVVVGVVVLSRDEPERSNAASGAVSTAAEPGPTIVDEAIERADEINRYCAQFARPIVESAESIPPSQREQYAKLARDQIAQCVESEVSEYDGPGNISTDGGVATAVATAGDAPGGYDEGDPPPKQSAADADAHADASMSEAGDPGNPAECGRANGEVVQATSVGCATALTLVKQVSSASRCGPRAGADQVKCAVGRYHCVLDANIDPANPWSAQCSSDPDFGDAAPRVTFHVPAPR